MIRTISEIASQIASEITNHKMLYVVGAPSVGVTLVDLPAKQSLVTSLDQVQLFSTQYSISFFVEALAAAGVVCMVSHYVYRFVRWAWSKRNG